MQISLEDVRLLSFYEFYDVGCLEPCFVLDVNERIP